MNHKANGAYAKRAPNGGKLAMPVLFLHGAYDTTCETVHSRLAEPMRARLRRPHRGRRELGSLDGAGAAGRRSMPRVAKWLATQLPDYWKA